MGKLNSRSMLFSMWLICFLLLSGHFVSGQKSIKKPVHYEKKSAEKSKINFGCTFEDGPFDAMIQITRGQDRQKIKTIVQVQGCQVIEIQGNKIQIGKFSPADIDDSGITSLLTDQHVMVEIHLILP